MRWRQRGGGPDRVALTVAQPEAVELYYSCCARVDRHNRCRQDDLRLEHKLGTHSWSQRVILSILGMCIVDAWLLYCGARGPRATLTQNQFYEDLAADLIENNYEAVGLRSRNAGESEESDVKQPAYGVGFHLTPTNKRRSTGSAQACDQRAQRACSVCKRKGTSYVCSGCRESKTGEVYCCGPKTGRSCFEEHLNVSHEVGV